MVMTSNPKVRVPVSGAGVSMPALVVALVVAIVIGTLPGCAAWLSHPGTKQSASVVDYLYPNAKEAPQLAPGVTTLRPPVRAGIAFVPGGGWSGGLPEAQRMRLLERVKAAFSKHEFIGAIEVIPTAYLQPKGGFANLDQVGRMFNLDVIALLSYDQVQFNDSNALSVLYWTIVGAYVVHGDQYDIQTLVDASVFDVASHKLLFRAPGTSRVKGSASMAGFSEKSREAQNAGYDQSVDELIVQLQAQLEAFRVRIKSDKDFKVENRDGYRGGGGALDFWSLMSLAALMVLMQHMRRRGPSRVSRPS
jgi:rhombotail lipoprotein